MQSSNWIKLAIVLAFGTSIGLVYGWVIDPVEYTDVTPGILREDYRADYVLMVAEAYRAEQDSDMAARRLAIISSETPAQIVSITLNYARSTDFTQTEIATLQGLLSAMQTFQPKGNEFP